MLYNASFFPELIDITMFPFPVFYQEQVHILPDSATKMYECKMLFR